MSEKTPESLYIDPRVLRTMQTEPDSLPHDGPPKRRFMSEEAVSSLLSKQRDDFRASIPEEFVVQIMAAQRPRFPKDPETGDYGFEQGPLVLALTNLGGIWQMIGSGDANTTWIQIPGPFYYRDNRDGPEL